MSLKVRLLGTLSIVLGACFGLMLSHSIAFGASTLNSMGGPTSYGPFVLGFGGVCLLVVLPALLSIVDRMVFNPLSTLVHAVEETHRKGEPLPEVRHLLERRDELGQLARHFVQLLAQADIDTRARREQIHAAFGHMLQGLCIFDAQHRLVICNRRFTDIHGLEPGSLLPGTRFWEVQELCKDAGSYSEEEVVRIERELLAQLRLGQPHCYVETVRGGLTVSVTRIPLPAGGWFDTCEDVTERKRAESRLTHMAHHDALTGLPNRVALLAEMEATLAHVSYKRMLAVHYLDLDRFKSVNDTLGHAVGDQLLKAVSERLRATLRDADVVARIGGDEFVVVQRNVTSLQQPGQLAQRLIEVLARPFEIGDHRILTGTSVGIALAPFSSSNPVELLEVADAALYCSKSGGRGRYQYACTSGEAAQQITPEPVRRQVI